MNPLIRNLLATVLACGVLPFLASCASSGTAPVKKSTSTSLKKGVPGGILVETYEIPVTVTRIDRGARTVTLLAQDGTYNTFKAGPQDPAFDQLREGELIKARVAREMIIFLGKEGPPDMDDLSAKSTLEHKPASSDVLYGKRERRDARIAAVDTQQRLVALLFLDGSTQTFPVRKDVDMSELTPGADVVILTGAAVTLEVTKP
ncbi:MAG TPA: hypothetical protein PKA41_09670 [Verrucomicrobiota bacterium]|nr:hypothetical protein [Verrucomicrobiota bacterium]